MSTKRVDEVWDKALGAHTQSPRFVGYTSSLALRRRNCFGATYTLANVETPGNPGRTANHFTFSGLGLYIEPLQGMDPFRACSGQDRRPGLCVSNDSDICQGGLLLSVR